MAWNGMESSGIYSARKDISKKLMIFESDKNGDRIPPFDRKTSCLKRIRRYSTVEDPQGQS